MRKIDRFLPKAEVLERIGCKSNSWMYKKIAEGSFPPPVKLGRSSVWLESEVADYIAARIEERDGKATDMPQAA